MTDPRDRPTTNDLAKGGEQRIAWIRSRMAMLARTTKEFVETKPLAGHTIGMSLHLEPKTAVLLETLAAGGAKIVATGNHGSTQDDIVAALRKRGMTVYGSRADSLEQHRRNLAGVLDAQPDILLDNGADLAAGVVERATARSVIGGTEETTSGGFRLREELLGRVPFPIIVINDSLLKAIGENRHAVGQSVVESFMRITNLMIPGKHVVVVGYGWCGRGVAQYFRSLGAQVTVVDNDVLKAFEAVLDGYRVTPIEDAAGWADVIITATGQPGVLGVQAFSRLRSGVVLANCGHFPWEIDVKSLKAQASAITNVDDTIERAEFSDGRHVILIAGGRMFNLAGKNPKGNSIESMDIGFMLQALCLEHVARHHDSMQAGAQGVPRKIEEEIARRLLEALGVSR